jgi:hypothetical protein
MHARYSRKAKMSPALLKTRVVTGIANFGALQQSMHPHITSRPSKMSTCAAFLASSEAFNLTGGILPIDGETNIVRGRIDQWLGIQARMKKHRTLQRMKT